MPVVYGKWLTFSFGSRGHMSTFLKSKIIMTDMSDTFTRMAKNWIGRKIKLVLSLQQVAPSGMLVMREDAAQPSLN